eukprot:CAMPEP_0181293350 /NCGR_PEP_ID=MMETSP1101-20121128/3019_1 /TAXON_ID=46948 /ORGANISM="Rhodomonas abbreviata, Strain Caron Lab Isolate" /LENGTH=113 /DNA_ID=CAMNT_0023397933 /DNA_START=920 /DNA_END=1261 /DNA_ORIENTATION=-
MKPTPTGRTSVPRLVDVDDVTEPLVLVLGRVDGLGDVPGDGGVIELVIDVVVHAAGHALEELRHVAAPGITPVPGGVIEHRSSLDELEQTWGTHDYCGNKERTKRHQNPPNSY